MPSSKGFFRACLADNREIALALALLCMASVVPALGVAFVLGQAVRQLQSAPVDLDWPSLVGDHIARWLAHAVRDTPYEFGIPASVQLALLPASLAIVAALHAAIKAAVEYLSERLSENVAEKTQNRIMSRFFDLPYVSAESVSPSQMATLIGTDVQEIKVGVRRLSGLVPINALQSFVLLSWLVILDTELFALFVAVLAPSAIAIRLLAKALKRLAKEGLALQAEVLGLFVERVRGWETIRVFGTLPKELQSFRTRNMQLFKRLRRTARASGLGTPTVEWLATVAGAVVVIIALRRLAVSELSSSVLTCFLVAIAQLSGSLQGLTRHMTSLRRARASMDRVTDFLADSDTRMPNPIVSSGLPEQKNAVPPRSPPVPPKQPQQEQIKSLELDHLAISDHSGRRILIQGLSLKLQCGDFCVILGPSGSGKSTLLRCLTGLQSPVSGRVLVNGTPPNKDDWSRLSSDLSFIAQDPFVVHGSLADNIVFPNKLAEIPKSSSLTERINTALFQAGLRKPADSPASELSGGEKQRLMLARAFFRGATLWILDESTSALDAATEHEFLETLKAMAANHIVVFVTHRSSVARYANQRITLDQNVP